MRGRRRDHPQHRDPPDLPCGPHRQRRRGDRRRQRPVGRRDAQGRRDPLHCVATATRVRRGDRRNRLCRDGRSGVRVQREHPLSGACLRRGGDVGSDRGVLPAVPHGAVRPPAVHSVHGDRDRLGRDGRAIRGRSDRLRDCGVGGRDGPARDLEPQCVGGRLPAGLPRLPDADLRRLPCRVGPAAPARSGVGAALPVAVRRCWLVHQSRGRDVVLDGATPVGARVGPRFGGTGGGAVDARLPGQCQ